MENQQVEMGQVQHPGLPGWPTRQVSKVTVNNQKKTYYIYICLLYIYICSWTHGFLDEGIKRVIILSKWLGLFGLSNIFFSVCYLSDLSVKVVVLTPACLHTYICIYIIKLKFGEFEIVRRLDSFCL